MDQKQSSSPFNSQNFQNAAQNHQENQISNPGQSNQAQIYNLSQINTQENLRNTQRLKTLKELYEKCNRAKVQISEFLTRLDLQENTVDYNTALDYFKLISSELLGILRSMDSEKNDFLNNQILVPLKLVNEPDEKLIKITENRVPFFNHDVVPDMLRTKLDNEIENEMNNLEKAAIDKYCVNLNDKNEHLETTINNLAIRLKKMSDKIHISIRNSNNTINDINNPKNKLNTSMNEHTNVLLDIYRNGIGLTVNPIPSNHNHTQNINSSSVNQNLENIANSENLQNYQNQNLDDNVNIDKRLGHYKSLIKTENIDRPEHSMLNRENNPHLQNRETTQILPAGSYPKKESKATRGKGNKRKNNA